MYTKYKEEADQDKIIEEGNEYLENKYPLLSYVVATEVIDPPDGYYGGDGKKTSNSDEL